MYNQANRGFCMQGYQHFGVMVDVSRNGVLNHDELIRFVDLIAKMGYDTLELYSEDIYEIDGEPYFGYLRGAYSKKEIQELDRYCASKGVELIPCIQTLAHFTNPAKLGCFQKLLDIDDILNVDKPEVYDFIERLIANVRACFTSKNLNIGMDEAYNLGYGKHLREYGYEKQGEIIARHLERVAKIAKKYDFDCHMWGDMFVRLSNNGHYLDEIDIENFHAPEEVVNRIPSNVSLAYWDYGHEDPHFYDRMFEFYGEFHHPVWFAGAGYTWRGFCPQNAYSLGLLKASFQSMRKNHVEHYLLTLWGDNGKECSLYEALPVIFAASEFAKGNENVSDIAKKMKDVLGLSFEDFLLLDKPNLGTLKGELLGGANSLSKCLLYSDPLMGVYDLDFKELDPMDFKAMKIEIEEAGKRNEPYRYVFDMVASLCGVLEHKAYWGIKAHEAYFAQDKKELRFLCDECDAIVESLNVFQNAFEKMWLKENKAFGYEIQCARLGGLKERMAYAKRRLNAYLKGEIDSIEELEAKQLPSYRPEGLRVNNYRWSISTSEI